MRIFIGSFHGYDRFPGYGYCIRDIRQNILDLSPGNINNMLHVMQIEVRYRTFYSRTICTVSGTYVGCCYG